MNVASTKVSTDFSKTYAINCDKDDDTACKEPDQDEVN